MAFFFLLVGLEIKRELVNGELASPRQAALPIVAAVGGMLVPALLYSLINPIGSAFQKGWGVSTVTDIAFAIGVLTLLGNRVPIGLKVFLTALAIVDDLGAILLIALFYSQHIDGLFLAFSLLTVLGLYGLNRFRISSSLLYLLGGLCLWIFLLKTGVHATLAGVLLAFTLPTPATPSNADTSNASKTPFLTSLEHHLHPWISYLILPLFALANAGVAVPTSPLAEAFTHPITLGILTGLCLGKPIGITMFSWLAIRLQWATLPNNVRWTGLIGASVLGGIGFTMSIFIALLAFTDPMHLNQAKLGILSASWLSGIVGTLLLRHVFHHPQATPFPEEA